MSSDDAAIVSVPADDADDNDNDLSAADDAASNGHANARVSSRGASASASASASAAASAGPSSHLAEDGSKRARKPSAKQQFLETNSADWEKHNKDLEAQKAQRKKEQPGSPKSNKSATKSSKKTAAKKSSKKSSAKKSAGSKKASKKDGGPTGSPAKKASTKKAAGSKKKEGGAKKKAAAGKKAPSSPKADGKPTYHHMITSSISALKERGGSSTIAIEKYIVGNYPTIEFAKHHLKKALQTGVEKGEFIKIANSYKIAK